MHTPINKLIYLDAFFGGEEKGPLIGKNIPAKNLTLDISKKLKNMLEKKSIPVILSRDNDESIPLDLRIVKSNMKYSLIYIGIKVDRANKDCIMFIYPLEEQSLCKRKNPSMVDNLEELTRQGIVRGSRMLAQTIYLSSKGKQIISCWETRADKKFILENVNSPAIIISFMVSDIPPMAPYVLESVVMEKIINIISRGIQEYLKNLQPLRLSR